LQEQSLSQDQIREFVIAGHGNLKKVKEMLTEHPELLNSSYQWTESDAETAIQAAAQVGSAEVAEFLIQQGAPAEICTAAMLGRDDDVKHRLDLEPEGVNAVGAHGIPLLPHAVLSGKLGLVQLVYGRGATNGANLALHNAVAKTNLEIVKWLLENTKADLASKNFQGKTPLSVALERHADGIASLLKEHGATE
jgi:uncharacterized protein